MRVLTALAVVVALVVFAAFAIGPTLVDAHYNTHEARPLPGVESRARALHERAFVADLHSDLLLWGRDPLGHASWGHTDLGRWRAGNVALQVLSTVTKVPAGTNFESNPSDASDIITLLAVLQRWPPRTWGSLYERALVQARRLDDAVARSQGALRPIRTRSDLAALVTDRATGVDVTGALLASEGMHPLMGELEHVDDLFAAGFRMLAPTHFFDNEVGGSAHGSEKGGLTAFGERAIDRMGELRMVVDLAHASSAVVDDVLDRVTRPVVVSHTGVQGTCPGPRNLSDAHVRRIAAGGGLIGIGFFAGALCEATIAESVRAIRYVADLVGTPHVALGSDWDGSTSVPFDAGELPHLTQALVDAGFSDDEILAILGGNVVRVLSQLLPD